MKLSGVTKRYGEKFALQNIDLEIEEGKITAVLGESGAGKTTLLNILAGLTPFEGKTEGVGKVSYLFQESALLPNLTVEGNLKFVLPKEKWGEIADMVCRVGLKGREKSRPKELSGGEKQRVAIARAFLYPHDVLLMDEPFSSLDLSLKKTLIELIVELWQGSQETVVFVTHDVHEAALLARRAVVLRAGTIVGDYPVPERFPRNFFDHSFVESLLTRTLMDQPPREGGGV